MSISPDVFMLIYHDVPMTTPDLAHISNILYMSQPTQLIILNMIHIHNMGHIITLMYCTELYSQFQFSTFSICVFPTSEGLR